MDIKKRTGGHVPEILIMRLMYTNGRVIYAFFLDVLTRNQLDLVGVYQGHIQYLELHTTKNRYISIFRSFPYHSIYIL